ncbi:MAG: RAD55 family ATPase [Candidatus Kariarchaeaceae archaeon]|jgi:circadian clock protein KaiC
MTGENVVTTGIEGLDELLSGGLIRNRSILIQGETGTGKTTLGVQFLVNGALKYDEPGLLLLMEYDVEDLIKDMSSYSWPIKQLIQEKKLSIITPPGGLESAAPMELDDLINFIHKETGKIDAKRLVIDSLNTLEVSFTESTNIRRELIRFITLIRDLDCTNLLLSETHDNQYVEIYSFVAHGVITLLNTKLGANRIRALEILKMRGIHHSTLTHSMSIQPDKGIEILPHEINLS